jgi:hypothetical protein
MKKENPRKTPPTYKSEAHQQLSTQVAQEAHTDPEILNSGLPKQVNPQSHLVAMLCLLKPAQRCKLLQELSQEEEEAEMTPLQDQATSPKICNTSETYSILPLEEPLAPLMGLEDLTGLEAQEAHKPYHPDISSLFNQSETSSKQE